MSVIACSGFATLLSRFQERFDVEDATSKSNVTESCMLYIFLVKHFNNSVVVGDETRDYFEGVTLDEWQPEFEQALELLLTASDKEFEINEGIDVFLQVIRNTKDLAVNLPEFCLKKLLNLARVKDRKVRARTVEMIG